MKKLFVFSFLVSCFLFLSACQQAEKNNEIEHVLAEQGLIEQEQAKQALASLLVTAYDLIFLTDIIEDIQPYWATIDQPLNVTIFEQMDNEYTYQAVFNSENDWTLSGETTEDEKFVLKRTNEGVMFEYEQYKEELSEEAFLLLNPFEHFRILHDVLQNNKYEQVSWNHKEDKWVIGISTTTSWLKEHFSSYLQSHMPSFEKEVDMLLESYHMEYFLTFTETEAEWNIQSIEFILQKEGQYLEHMIFEF